MFVRYVKSKRHTMQVDFDDYLLELEHEMRRGSKRAGLKQAASATSA
jgi:hypothetical protein